MAVSAGRLNKLIDILKPDYQHQYKETVDYVVLHEAVPAQKKDTSGGEAERGKKVEETTTSVFTIRYLAGIEKTMRVRCEGVDYEISRALDRDGRRNWLELQCVDVQ